MYKVGIYLRVRKACFVEGMSVREAARVFGLHRDTVRKMLEYSVPPGYRRQRPARRPKLDPYKGVMDQILEQDLTSPKKQRHTAKRIYERLRDEHGFPGKYTIVKDYVRERRRHTREMFLPLSHPPGHAQCDYGEARVIIGGVERKAHYFALDLPHSDGCYVKAYPAETTESFCDGHVSAFAFLGGVPQSILYDNTTLAVARILGDGRRQRTRVFSELQSHYLFEDRFGRPGKGKGFIRLLTQGSLATTPSFLYNIPHTGKGGIQMPGKSFRQGITLIEAVKQFGDEEAAEVMFIEARWPNGVACPGCGSLNVQERPTRKPQPFRCRDCRKDFSVKTDTVMQGSNIPLHKWALAVFLMNTSLKGVSSMKLHRDLGISQPSAWHLAHRIRKAWETDGGLFGGPVEIDETYIGGKERNKHESKKLHAGRGAVGKMAVVGAKDRETGKVSTAAVASTDAPTLQGFVETRTEPTAQVYTDEAAAYNGLNRSHETVKHSAREYVHGMAHTNGIESHWAMLKRGYVGVYHQIER